jgi:hypothetical protein
MATTLRFSQRDGRTWRSVTALLTTVPPQWDLRRATSAGEARLAPIRQAIRGILARLGAARSASMRINWSYFASRSDRDIDPVLM